MAAQGSLDECTILSICALEYLHGVINVKVSRRKSMAALRTPVHAELTTTSVCSALHLQTEMITTRSPFDD
ncbi:hypothetical protein VNO77_37441 [Canavalia gladiata]|uniref:Uncharacterized protein n=1 Tax=Canavalia gladiata TaxID=3824 RepID=A0AAN9PYG8_CANGL